MSEFKMRTSKPAAGNKYYIRKASGGYSPCIVGKPTDSACNVLANCVGYAVGRFNEIGGYGECRYLKSTDAEYFIQYRGTCNISQEPSLGAVMVWQQGAMGGTGKGHVCIVERVDSATQVYTSESAYGSSHFYNQTRKKGADGNWGASAAKGYKFLGFIVNPAVSDSTPQSDPGPEEYFTYVVVKGDTLSKIAGRYGTTYQILAAINGIPNPNKIGIGQALKIPKPSAESTPEPSEPTMKYKVGDAVVITGTLWSSSAGGKKGKTVNGKKTKITRVAVGAKYPYNTTGDLGWMSESSIQGA